MANALSLLRLLLALPAAWAVARGGVTPGLFAATLFCVAIATDLLDGRLARARGTASALGRALDHGSDFAYVTSGLAAAAARGALPWLLPILVTIAFSQYVIDSYLLQRARELRMSALGRWNGVLYFVPLAGAILCQLGLEFLAGPTRWVALALCVSTLLSIGDRLFALSKGAATALLLLLLTASGCATAPPPAAPSAPAKRPAQEFSAATPDGVGLIYDPSLGLYAVAGSPGRYWLDGHYYRRTGDRWQLGPAPDGPWRDCLPGELPLGFGTRP
jgi:CDP-diacylglycerol--glycerol-3-phosphate 3-phosphatidyltransferase